MEPLFWILLPGFAAVSTGLLAWFIMQSRMEVALAEQREQIAETRGGLDAAHARVMEAQSARRDLTGQIGIFEQRARDTADAKQKHDFEQSAAHMKTEIEALGTEESQRRSVEVDAESQLRAEKTRLADLQGLLDRLDKALDELAGRKR